MVSILSQQNGENSSFSNKKQKNVSGNLMSLDEVDTLDAEDIALWESFGIFFWCLKNRFTVVFSDMQVVHNLQ